MYKKLLVIVAVVLFALSAHAAGLSSVASAKEDLTIEDIINNIQANQTKIKDMYAETTTTITSNVSMPGTESKGPQKMVQKGKMWTKGKDKSKIEMISPMKQITITNGDQMAIINPETGQKMVQDLKKLREKSGMQAGSGQMSLEKAKEFFDLSTAKKGDDYVIVGIPKKENKFLGKMEFYVDSERWVPTKILMYVPKDKLMSQSEIEYGEFSGVWTPIRNVSDVNSPMGKMSIEMKYENVKINQGVNDSEFKI